MARTTSNPQIPPSTTSFNIPFMRLKWIFISISLALTIFSFVTFFTKGFNFGVDFKGGVKLIYQFKEPIGDEKIRGILEPLNLGDAQIVQFGKKEDNSFLVKVKLQEERDLVKDITGKLHEGLTPQGVTLLSEEVVGPKVGAELRQRGLFAIILTWVFMLIYIGWRFDFLFAPGAVIALVHDIIISVGIYVFLGREFNLPILAAVLTLIGYSVNDTIVIYDRVRENLKKLPASMPLADLVDRSVNETLTRSIITSLTVFFAMAVLFFFGGGVLYDFALYMLIGVIVGSYSTIFIASPVYLGFHRLFPHKGMARSVSKR